MRSIEAFARVWLFITETPHYPMGYSHSEPAEQWTLFTAHRLAFFNYLRFLDGAHGSYNYKKYNLPILRETEKSLSFGPSMWTIPFTA